MPWRNADLDFAFGAPRNQCSAFTLLPTKTAILWKTKMNQAGDYVSMVCTIFQARVEGQRHHHYENILRYVQKAPDRNEFDELMATEKESAPGPDGIPYSFYRCAGDWAPDKHVPEGGTVPALFAESRTVFIPKSSDVDNNGRIVRSPEALRPLALCNCDCKILTTATCRRFHEIYTSFSEMYFIQTNDG